ncbi:MAG: response regulator [Chloroherpetonaceae bacterium]|nr:response regulator [Chloroherpetonaceae bacterium]MDW8436608.1 response regulator [Chloroherpetonaceae bacterium]
MSKQKSQVLIVDDEPLVLSSLRNLLEFDYIVHTAESGREALKILTQFPIKVIMSDQRMPEMMGHEVLSEAKRISPATIRILLTGYSDLESIINSVNAGEIFRYISKPWKSEMILSVFKLGVQIYDRLSQFAPSPASMTSSEPTKPKVHIEVDEKSHSVLFVGYEDDEIKNLVEQIEKGYEVYKSQSIDEALRQIARKPVSVIVSNVNFGQDNALDFLNAVKSEYPEVVTVILTEVADANLAIRSINELNVFRYLIKPVSGDVFRQIIDNAVSQNQTYKEKPASNLIHAAKQIAPEVVASESQSESALRLKLRAAQLALSKAKPSGLG